MDKMSFEDLIFLLSAASQETITEFVNNVQAHLKSEDLFSFLEFVTQNYKKLLEKFKLNETIGAILLSK